MEYSHPKWLENAVFYEIYPQSFKDSDGDGIGDLNGITSKLDYIKDVGFNAIWLNPIFDSPFYDAGYDVTDYKKIAPRYGSLDDFKKLLKEAHKRGIKILLDLVPGHTSVYSKWFVKSCLDEKNKYSDRFIWTNGTWNITNEFAWLKGISQRDGAVMTNFFSIQPALNYGFYEKKYDYEEEITDKGPQSTIKDMIDVIDYWFEIGIDGFRVDMAGWLVKRDPDGIGTMKVWAQIFKNVKSKWPDKAFVSEWSQPLKSLACGFDMDFILQDSFAKYHTDLTRGENPYFSKKSKGNAAGFLNYHLNMFKKIVQEKCSISIISGNHDTIRISETLKSEEELKMFYAFLYTFPGVPFMYYGDEIGMKYVHGLKSVEGGYQRTGSRSPMLWDDSKNAGFSTADEKKLYIAQDSDPKRETVKSQENEPNSLLNFVKKMIQLRKNYTELHAYSNIEYLYLKENEYPLIYIRKNDAGQILVAINASKSKKEVTFDRLYSGNILLNYNNVKVKGNTLILPSQSVYVLKLN